MATIKGKWLFNKVLVLPEEDLWAGPSIDDGSIFFVSNGEGYTCIYVLTAASPHPIVYSHGYLFPYGERGEYAWQNEAYRTIDFGETEWTVDDAFYEWLTANATQTSTLAEKLTIITNNEQKVYDAGKSRGYSEGEAKGYAEGESKGYQNGYTEGLNKGGYADGFEAGKQAEWDAFWDAFQYSGGSRSGYAYGFYGGGWNDITFKPKYTLKPSTATYMFRNSNITEIIDVDYKTNKCNTFFGTYRGCSKLVRVGDIYAAYATNLGEMFHGCSKLVSTGVITVKNTANFDISFYGCEELVNITFDGTIGTDIAFTESTKLSADSIRNIIEHLSDNVSGKTLTLSKTAVETAIANGGFGGDTLYFSTNGAYQNYSYIYGNPIQLAKGQTIKIMGEWAGGHSIDRYTDWWFESCGTLEIGGTPGHSLPEFYTAEQDEQVTPIWVFYTDVAVDKIPIKIRVVLVDENGNETGENLHSLVTVGNTTLTITGESWETLKASKPNWTISLV